MGRKGWRGAPPADDTQAGERIVDAALASIERRGPRLTTLSEVAADVGITRPTIYRHFASTEALLAAAAEIALDHWTARIGRMVRDLGDATDLLVEAVAYLVERLPEEPLLALLLETDRSGVSRQMVMPAASPAPGSCSRTLRSPGQRQVSVARKWMTWSSTCTG